MTRGKNIAITAIALAAIGLLVAWFLLTFERKTQDFPLPPKGEAVYNPLYGLKVALLQAHQRVQTRPHLFDDKHPLQPGDTVLVLADPAQLSQREAQALRAHVARGGHLIVQAPNALLGKSGRVPLLEGLGVLNHAFVEDACLFAKGAQAKDYSNASHLLCADRFTLAKSAAPVLAWRDPYGTAFARFREGAGTLDVVATLDIARSSSLRWGGNSALLSQVLRPNWNRGTFHLIYASEMPSLWRLLAENTWRVLIALVLCIGAWLWMRMQRFGPRLPSPPDARRSLLEHVQATGDHLYRYGRAHLLHAALRKHVIARLRRTDAVAAALDGQAQVDRLAQRTGLPPADIADALHSPRPFDAKDFRFRIARLIALGRHT